MQQMKISKLSEEDLYKAYVECGRNTKKFAEKFGMSPRTAQRYLPRFLAIEKKITRQWFNSFDFEEETRDVAELLIANQSKKAVLVNKALDLLNTKIENLSQVLDPSMLDTKEILEIIRTIDKYDTNTDGGGTGKEDFIEALFAKGGGDGGGSSEIQSEIQKATSLQLSDSSVPNADGGISPR